MTNFVDQRLIAVWVEHPLFSSLYSPRPAELLGPARKKEDELTQRHKDIARSVQGMYRHQGLAGWCFVIQTSNV